MVLFIWHIFLWLFKMLAYVVGGVFVLWVMAMIVFVLISIYCVDKKQHDMEGRK
jgi:hypothetical protein